MSSNLTPSATQVISAQTRACQDDSTSARISNAARPPSTQSARRNIGLKRRSRLLGSSIMALAAFDTSANAKPAHLCRRAFFLRYFVPSERTALTFDPARTLVRAAEHRPKGSVASVRETTSMKALSPAKPLPRHIRLRISAPHCSRSGRVVQT